MTPRERVYAALDFEQTDIVPYHVEFTGVARQSLADYWGDPEFSSGIGNHLACLSHRIGSRWEEVAPGHFRDEWGVVWNRTVDRDIGTVENCVLPEPDLTGYEFPDPHSHELFDRYPGFVEANRDLFRVSSIGFTLFERAWTLRGMEQLLTDMIERPDFVRGLFDRITEFQLAQIDRALEHDIDAIRFGDDWGSQNGLIMGPHLWREFVKPCVRRLYQRVREAGRFVFIHSCGDVNAIMPDLVECGVQVFNPFQPEVMDVFETKRRYHGRLAFYGGISVQRLLPHGTPDEVRCEVRRLLDELGTGGGYIAAPSHAVPADVPPENAAAMIEVLQRQ